MSPRKKRMKKSPKVNKSKRSVEGKTTPSKRLKTEKSKEEELQAMLKKNFVCACQQVSYENYLNHMSKLLLLYTPPGVGGTCQFLDESDSLPQVIPVYAEESFRIEIKTGMWLEALEVCQLCISPTQYLSANVLKDVVEILLNSHKDEFGGYTIDSLIANCQQILSHHFVTHPPCLTKSVREVYNNFLFSPMDTKEQTFTNRYKFESRKGIVQYCFRRLEYEISTESIDGPLLDKEENTPKEMQNTIQGLHWQKEKFEILEMLNRPERIERLMAVLESIIVLLQLDLATWHSRYINELTCRVKRLHKPLMAIVLWANEYLYNGAVNNNCRLILSLFVNVVHLKYPNEYIRIMMTWLNAMVQTFYLCEKDSNSDFPNIGPFCSKFAMEFYKIISEKPQDSVLRILEHIKPTYMQYLTALLHVQKLLSTNEKCIITILIRFLNETQWKQFNESEREIKLSTKLFKKPRKVQNKLMFLSKICSECLLIESFDCTESTYPKLNSRPEGFDEEIDLNTIVHAMFIALESYLDTYNVQRFQETREFLNKNLQNSESETNMPKMEFYSYSVSENLVVKYRNICTKLKEFVLAFQNLENRNQLPSVMKIFKKIDFLEL